MDRRLLWTDDTDYRSLRRAPAPTLSALDVLTLIAWLAGLAFFAAGWLS